jgi:hypothetical protein
MSMAHLVRAILGGLHRGAWWRLSLFRLRSLGNHPNLLCVRRYAKKKKFKLAAHTVRAPAAPHPIHPGWCS